MASPPYGLKLIWLFCNTNWNTLIPFTCILVLTVIFIIISKYYLLILNVIYFKDLYNISCLPRFFLSKDIEYPINALASLTSFFCKNWRNIWINKENVVAFVNFVLKLQLSCQVYIFITRQTKLKKNIHSVYNFLRNVKFLIHFTHKMCFFAYFCLN